MAQAYKIATASEQSHLCDEVNKLIAEGYQPIGGVCVSAHPYTESNKHGETWVASATQYSQAMLRQEVYVGNH